MLMMDVLSLFTNPSILSFLSIDPLAHFLLSIESDLCLLIVDAVIGSLCFIVLPLQGAEFVILVCKFDLEIIKTPGEHSQIIVKHGLSLLLVDKFILQVL